MATRTRDFGQAKTSQDYEPLEFKLNGQDFQCHRAVSGGVLLSFIADADSNEGGKSANAILTFFEKALVPEAYTRFSALIDDPDVIVDLSLLGEIATYLIEEYTSRPSQPSTSSEDGQ